MEEKKPNNLSGQMNNNVKYEPSKPDPQQQMAKVAEEFDKLKNKLEGFKKAVIKKHKFTMALVLLPGNSFQMFEEDEALSKEVIDSKPLHLMMVIPEDEYKNIPKIKPEVVKLLKDSGENIWLHIKTPVDLWNYGLDSKFEFIDAISAGFPIYDNGFLGCLRVADIHKSLVLRKFEKYVASYVIGGSLVRGTAIETSDVDTFVIIDDTDVKKMNRLDLLDRLRGIINDYIREATALAGVKNVLSVQVWLLTDFWQRVKDAEPVAFTFIRDGIPLHDRGTFIPWKLLLKMGRIKPSPEAVDMYIKQGEQTKDMVNRRLIDAMIDVYYGVLTPAQAMMMLVGHSPPTHKEAPRVFKENFYDKEKLVDLKYIKILEKAVRLFKEYEHGKLTTIPGKEIDVLLKDCIDFNEMIKKLRSKLEVRLREETVEKINSELFELLKHIFGNKGQNALIEDMNKELVKKGKIAPRMLEIAKEIIKFRVKMKNKKASQSETQRISGEATELMNALIEYSQRKDIVKAEKGIIQIAYSGRKADIILTDAGVFLTEASGIRKIQGDKLVDSNKKELEDALSKTKDRLTVSLPAKALDVLKKELGDYEVLL